MQSTLHIPRDVLQAWYPTGCSAHHTIRIHAYPVAALLLYSLGHGLWGIPQATRDGVGWM